LFAEIEAACAESRSPMSRIAAHVEFSQTRQMLDQLLLRQLLRFIARIQ